MVVNTGYGYIKDSQDRIIAKYVLPKGEHLLDSGLIQYEVKNKEDLENIEVYQEPYIPTLADDREALIQERMRKNAEAELIKEGKISA
jgi:hypothetical protein